MLDIGGTQYFWETMRFSSKDVEIWLLNIESEIVSLPNFKFIKGDALNLKSFKDREFDIVFSNSLIEHLPEEAQKEFAREVCRIGKGYFIQTPNRNFFFEPHFLVPFFQFFPIWLKVFLVRHFSCGWVGKIKDRDSAYRVVSSIKMLTAEKLTQLFPNGRLFRERFLGLTKSFIVYGRT